MNQQRYKTPAGLDGFRPHTDPANLFWWYRSVDGWEYFARPVATNANRESSPMQILAQSTENFGLDLRDTRHDAGDGWELRSNSDSLSETILGRDREAEIEAVEQRQPLPWERDLSPKVSVDFGLITSVVVAGAIVGACLLVAAIIYAVRR